MVFSDAPPYFAGGHVSGRHYTAGISPAQEARYRGGPRDAAGAVLFGFGVFFLLAAAEADEIDGDKQQIEESTDGDDQRPEQQRLRGNKRETSIKLYNFQAGLIDTLRSRPEAALLMTTCPF